MKLVEYPDRDLLMLALADQIAGELGDFLRREGRASFCVPGGTTPTTAPRAAAANAAANSTARPISFVG